MLASFPGCRKSLYTELCHLLGARGHTRQILLWQGAPEAASCSSSAGLACSLLPWPLASDWFSSPVLHLPLNSRSPVSSQHSPFLPEAAILSTEGSWLMKQTYSSTFSFYSLLVFSSSASRHQSSTLEQSVSTPVPPPPAGSPNFHSASSCSLSEPGHMLILQSSECCRGFSPGKTFRTF